MQRASVVFPDPDSPTSARLAPVGIDSEMPCSTGRDP